MLTTDPPTRPGAAAGNPVGHRGRTDPWATSCPDHCHYCSGPETD